MKYQISAFTLAEVLVTLVIIGIVAVLTIPAVVKNHQEKTWNTASQVFERRLEEALKSMNVQETLSGYSNTRDFVEELAKHIKITKICENNDLLSCFSDKVYWGSDGQEVDMSEIKDASNLGQENWGTETISVRFANGVNAYIAYNPSCTQDPYNNQYKGTSCLAILYDTSAYKNPNKSGQDLRSINVLSLAGNNCFFKLGDVCYGQPFRPDPVSLEECREIQKDYPFSSGCYDEPDYYASAVRTCGGLGNMPSKNDLENLARYFYNMESWSQNNLSLDVDKVTKAGYTLTDDSVFIFGNFQHGAGLVSCYEYYKDRLGIVGGYHNNGGDKTYAVCKIQN